MADDFDDFTFLPWQLDTARAWLAARERFAHAWLIHGVAGIGKVRFARAAAASLLCEQPHDSVACGRCDACRWILRGNHPDLRVLRPDAVAQAEGAAPDTDPPPSSGAARRAPSRDIRIEQVRALETWLNTATHRGGYRIVLLYPAEALNAISANAMLKVLEEPPASTVFLVVADTPDKLLPTLVSRCRRLPMAAPSPAAATAWLEKAGMDKAAAYLAAAGGAPLAAWRAHEAGGPACPSWLRRWAEAGAAGRLPSVQSEIAGELEKIAPEQWLDALQRVLADLMRLQAGASVRYYPELYPALNAMSGRFTRVAIAQAARWLATQRRVARHPLSPTLFVNAVLLRLSHPASPS